MTTTNAKTCPKCAQEKSLDAFYRVKSRSDGYASWCKACTNGNRKRHKHKPTDKAKIQAYQKVSRAAQKSGKPTTCPDCHTEGVSSRRMRGYLNEDGTVGWNCITCEHAKRQAGKVLWGCDWCCKEKMVEPEEAEKRFCGSRCQHSYEAVAAERKVDFEALVAEVEAQRSEEEEESFSDRTTYGYPSPEHADLRRSATGRLEDPSHFRYYPTRFDDGYTH